MVDKEKNPKLYELIQSRIEMRERWLNEAIQAGELAAKLPDEILQMDITDIDSDTEGRLSLSINGDNKSAVVATLARLGATGLNPQVLWSSNIGASGTLKISDELMLRIGVNHLPKPANCHIKKIKRTITEESLVCDNTGEAPGVAAILAEE